MLELSKNTSHKYFGPSGMNSTTSMTITIFFTSIMESKYSKNKQKYLFSKPIHQNVYDNMWPDMNGIGAILCNFYQDKI